MAPLDRRLVDRAAALTDGRRRVILGIVGEPGAGKTTLATGLLEALAVRGVAAAWLPMDGFHLSDRSLEALGLRERKGAIETFDGWGYLAALRRAMEETEHAVYLPGFERTLEQPLAADRVIPPGPALIVTEGNYLLDDAAPWPLARGLMAEVWYVEEPDPVRRSRLVERHIRFGKTPSQAAAWVDAVDEPNARRVRRGRSAADVVVALSE